MPTTFYPTLHQHLATDYRRNLAVTAGAGTGKTAVLTRRIIKILAREKLFLDRLLVVTFTDKAAVEMKERIYDAIDKELAETGKPHFQKLKDTFFNNHISTFHAFCAALLREYPIEAGIDPYFRVLDETDKIFFLRKSINRSLKELAADRNNRDIHVLSEVFSKSAIGSFIFMIIQKREDTGSWLVDRADLDRQRYLERLEAYRDCMVREMAYKLHHNKGLDACLEQLEQLAAVIPADSSSLSRKRADLLRLIPQLQDELAPAAVTNVDADRIVALKAEIMQSSKLSAPPESWPEEAYAELKGVFTSLRYLLKPFTVEDFVITESHEQCGFELIQALAHLARHCLISYHDDKARENYLDFQDLQLKVLHLFMEKKHSHILDELRERFLFVLVDEFQDTNDLQWQIIKKIAADRTESVVNPKLFIVGDEKQAIYSFRGGDVRLFSRVRHELQKANRNRGHDQHPFDLNLDGVKDYAAEYRDKISDDSVPRAGEIVFADNFRSAATPINFFNMFFHDLLSKEIYEEYDARPQRLVCSGNQTTGSVELLLADSDAEGDDEALSLAGTHLEEAGDDAPPPHALGRVKGTVPEKAPEEKATPDIELSDHFKEALLIVDKIKEVFLGDDEKYRRVRQKAQKGEPAVAILLNRRTMLKTYEEALRLNRIDFTVVRGRGFFQRREIVDLGNLLRFLTNTADGLSLAAFLRSPAGRLSDEGLFLLSKLPGETDFWHKLRAAAREAGASPGEIYNAATPPFSAWDRESLVYAAAGLERWLRLAGRVPLGEFLRLILDEGGYYASLCRGNRGEQAVSNVEKLLESARALSLEEGGDLADFSEWLNNRIDYIDEEGEADIDISLGGAVQIMTVHQSKGLEFPMVFVPDMGAYFNLGEREPLHADQVPFTMAVGDEGITRRERLEIGINAPNPENEWENEPILIKRIIRKRLRDKLIAEKKRLLYVAATRAMDHLVLVGHADLESDTVMLRVQYAPMDQLISWMDWLNRILNLTFNANGFRGEIVYGNRAGETMHIPYRKFSAAEAPLGVEAVYRTIYR